MSGMGEKSGDCGKRDWVREGSGMGLTVVILKVGRVGKYKIVKNNTGVGILLDIQEYTSGLLDIQHL